ncbi:MAG: hypothetical protein ACR2KJ_14760 [Jatrophihabitans sp.]
MTEPIERGPTEGDPALDGEPLIIYLHPYEGRQVNPNTPEGELRSVAAFAAGINNAPPAQRTVAKVVVWLILIGMITAVLVGVVAGTHTL